MITKGLLPPRAAGRCDAFVYIKVLARWLDIASAQSPLAMPEVLGWAFTGRGSRGVLHDTDIRAEIMAVSHERKVPKMEGRPW